MLNSKLAKPFLQMLIFLSLLNLSSPLDNEDSRKNKKSYPHSYYEREFPNIQGLGEYQMVREERIVQHYVNQRNVVHNSRDITRYNPQHEDVSVETLLGDATNHPHAIRGNNHHHNGQQDHNSVFMSPNYSYTRTNNGTIPFSQFVNHPIGMGSSSNYIGQPLYPTSVVNLGQPLYPTSVVNPSQPLYPTSAVNPGQPLYPTSTVNPHQFYANNPHLLINDFSKPVRTNIAYPMLHMNPPSLPLYHINTNQFPSSSESRVVHTQTHVGPQSNFNYDYNYDVDQVYQRPKRQKLGGQAEFVITTPPTRPNIINFSPPEARNEIVFNGETRNEIVFNVEARNEIVFNGEADNDVGEQEEELDLELHL